MTDSSAASFRIFVHELRLSAYIGLCPAERETRQPVIISLTADYRPDEAVSRSPGALQPAVFSDASAFKAPDAPSSIVCYGALVSRIEALLAQGPVGLVETLAEAIARLCLADRRVRRVTVRVAKPDAIGNAGSAGVEIVRYARARKGETQQGKTA